MEPGKVNNRDFYSRFSGEDLIELTNYCIAKQNTDLPPLHFISAHAFVEGTKSEILAEIYRSGKLICDSKPLSVYLSKALRIHTPHVRGTSFMRKLILTAPKGSRHYFLGGTDDTLTGIRNFIRENRGSELTCEYNSPEFNRAWDEISPHVLDNIKSFAPNFVWVGMGAPKQFYISAEIYEKLKVTSFSVGAAFDFIAGTKQECPKLISNLGMEWLFRLITEPRRLWRRYLIGNMEFIFYLLIDFTRNLKRDSNKL